jgi:hypothetical protein
MNKLIVVGAAMLLAIGGYLYVDHLKSEIAEAQYEQRVAWQNYRAAQETTVRIEDRFRRLVEQRELKADSLQRELDERPVVRTVVTITPDSAVVEVPAETEIVDSIATYLYETSVADVRVKVDWVTQDPPVITVLPKALVVNVDVACSDAGPVIDVRTARGDEVEIARSLIEPRVCNPPPENNSGRRGFLYGFAAGVVTLTAALVF